MGRNLREWKRLTLQRACFPVHKSLSHFCERNFCFAYVWTGFSSGWPKNSFLLPFPQILDLSNSQTAKHKSSKVLKDQLLSCTAILLNLLLHSWFHFDGGHKLANAFKLLPNSWSSSSLKILFVWEFFSWNSSSKACSRDWMCGVKTCRGFLLFIFCDGPSGKAKRD